MESVYIHVECAYDDVEHSAGRIYCADDHTERA